MHNVIVGDCLRLIANLLQHDASLAEVWFAQEDFFIVAPCLAQLLDLRLGIKLQSIQCWMCC